VLTKFDEIIEEIGNWINNYLDIPNEYYGGHRPCPFARPAWEKQQVKVVFGMKDEVERQVDQWNDSHRLVIVVYDADEWNAESYTEERNKQVVRKDLYLMSFDPDEDGPDDEALDPQAWGEITDEVYGMVFIQRLDDLQKYAEILKSQGYYDDLSPDFNNYVARRELANGWTQEDKR
tara:strand:- start:695 stop:1225 length:531 start_codon:yes stop_codon:yes gene_type:complete